MNEDRLAPSGVGQVSAWSGQAVGLRLIGGSLIAASGLAILRQLLGRRAPRRAAPAHLSIALSPDDHEELATITPIRRGVRYG
jgi:hypothetical protein